MTQYEYYKTMQELCLDVAKLKKSDYLTKIIYTHAAEGFEKKALSLPMSQAEKPMTEEQKKIYERFSAEVQEKKKLENC